MKTLLAVSCIIFSCFVASSHPHDELGYYENLSVLTFFSFADNFREAETEEVRNDNTSLFVLCSFNYWLFTRKAELRRSEKVDSVIRSLYKSTFSKEEFCSDLVDDPLGWIRAGRATGLRVTGFEMDFEAYEGFVREYFAFLQEGRD